MLMPAQVTFRGLSHSAQIEAEVLERVSWLEKFYSGLVSCRVLIEVPHRHRRDGRHFHVTIELTVPNGEAIVISHEPSLHGPLKDAGAPEQLKAAETDSVHRYARFAIRKLQPRPPASSGLREASTESGLGKHQWFREFIKEV